MSEENSLAKAPDQVPSVPKQRGLVGSLFDFQMQDLVTLKFTKIIYRVVVILSSIAAGIGMVVTIPTLIGPFAIAFIYLLYLIYFRMFLEFITSLVNVNYNTRRLVELSEHVMKNSK